MPVLEITQLRLTRLHPDDPALVETLSTVRDLLQTNSQFYACVEDPTIIYILGMWPSLEAHLAFLASPARDEILGPQQDMLEFQWTVHMELESMSSLPSYAPILAMERLSVQANYVDAFDQAAIRHVQVLQGSHQCEVALGWRIDAAAGSHEAIIFSGWTDAQAHVTFIARQQDPGNDNVTAAIEQYEELLVHHAKNLEREEA